MKKLKTAVVAAAAVASLTVSVSSARASVCETGAAGRYICEYGVSEHYLAPTGQTEEFLVGTDYAVWTRTITNGRSSSWKSLGGVVRSKVWVRGWAATEERWMTRIVVMGTDGKYYKRERISHLGDWRPWELAPEGRP